MIRRSDSKKSVKFFSWIRAWYAYIVFSYLYPLDHCENYDVLDERKIKTLKPIETSLEICLWWISPAQAGHAVRIVNYWMEIQRTNYWRQPKHEQFINKNALPDLLLFTCFWSSLLYFRPF